MSTQRPAEPPAVTALRANLLDAHGSLPPATINYGTARALDTALSRAGADAWQDGYAAALADLVALGAVRAELTTAPA